MSTAGVPEHGELAPPKLEEVSDGIFAYVQPDGSWGLNNTGFLVGSETVTIIDSCFTERRTRAFHDAIRQVTDLPLRTLVNTHHHGDHTHGNFVFLPAASIIAHEMCRKEVIDSGVAVTAFFPGVEWGQIRVAPPSVTFEDRLNLYLDDLKVELIHIGPAHTTNDVIAWVPDRKVLFSGDIIFNESTPFGLHGSIAGWLEALEAVRALGPETIVPGHGPVCGAGVIDEVAAYLRFVQEGARKGFEAGLSPLETARQTDLGRFAVWHDTERLVGNLHRAYSELRGEPRGTALDPGPIGADIITYNGGRPLRCLA